MQCRPCRQDGALVETSRGGTKGIPGCSRVSGTFFKSVWELHMNQGDEAHVAWPHPSMDRLS